jgi:hypothetical protein
MDAFLFRETGALSTIKQNRTLACTIKPRWDESEPSNIGQFDCNLLIKPGRLDGG